MKKYFIESNSKSISMYFIFAAVMVLSSVFAVKAQTVTFAQFVERNGTQDFVFTNNTTNATFNTVAGGSPIFFFYQNVTGLPAELQGTQFAHLTITTTTTQIANSSAGNLTQPLNQTVTISIIRDTPTAPGTGSGLRTNLLTAVITTNTSPSDIQGGANGSSATYSATTTPQNVVFTSDFLSFASSTARNLGLSFSSVTPSLNLGAGNFLQSFTAAATGTFASNPVPTYAPPTAASISLGGSVFTDENNPLTGAKVTLTEADGTIHETTTGSFGRYEFQGISAGQTVIVNVSSKRYSFQSQVVSLADNISDLNFYP